MAGPLSKKALHFKRHVAVAALVWDGERGRIRADTARIRYRYRRRHAVSVKSARSAAAASAMHGPGIVAAQRPPEIKFRKIMPLPAAWHRIDRPLRRGRSDRARHEMRIACDSPSL
ncbi:hypothetical protein [Sphingomonas glacialis]|uniref:hypothetical protein n=1 Tax=Sphingomonas glacialis TaxID=658225 RepID=UPI001386C149|nr:hypothetical protein [Sphingomonas glacialis]